MSEPVPPPANVAPYVAVLGVDLAIEFLLRFGGAELYLAPSPKGRAALAELIGVAKSAELAQAAEFLPRRVPLAKPWIAMTWRSKGLSVAEIARRLHVSDVTVRKWLKRSPDRVTDHRQLPLI